jgi:arginine/serine-rich splicing factor 17
MNAMKGMKLCYKDRDSEKAWTSNIRVDFDKTKHLAESSTKQRKAERERIINEEREKERQEKRQKEIEEMQKNQQLKVIMAEEKEREVKNAAKDLVKTQRRAAREAKRKAKTMHKMGLTEEEEMSERIGTEERKLLLAQRKLESIRILDELVERVKVMNSGPQQSS